MDEITSENIVLIKERNSYKIYIKDGSRYKKIKLISPILSLPFGREVYNHKNILNIEFTDKEKSNEVYNFFSRIREIDNIFRKMIYNKECKIIQDIENKSFYPTLRYRNNFDPLMRTYIKNNCSFIDGDNSISINELKGKSGNLIIELNSMWITKDSYGLTWITNGGKLSNQK